MKEYFKSGRSSLIVRDGITMHKEDELLLDKIIKFIEDNIDDESINPDSLADFIGVSKAGLYRKLKELTEKTPSHPPGICSGTIKDHQTYRYRDYV